jgi:hypothetical protein
VDASIGPVPQRKVVEPVLRRPAPEPPTPRRAAEPVLDPHRGTGEEEAEPSPPRAPPAPPFEWLDLVLVPPGAPSPRGHAVYSQAPRPVPAPVLLIDTAA